MTDTTAPVAASATPPPTEDAKKRRRELVEKLLARPAVRSEGEVRLGGKAMPYAVALEFIPVSGPVFADAGGEPEAAVFTTAYVLKGTEPRRRPVCFAFNGGPGSASIWLHLGALGPKRVQVNDDGTMPLPPYAVSDNPHSWFEHFDLVFIDPPHTGYSIAASEEARNKLLGVDGDVEALAEVIRAWLGRNQRWDSPIYLAGESYGTTRGAALADQLQSLGVALSGLILVSCAMDLQSIVFAPHNDLPYALFLPAFAGVAQYHGKLKGALGKSPEAARAAAEAFVEEDYLRALHRGATLDGKARERIVEAHRRARRPRAGARRREEPAHRRPGLLLRAAARTTAGWSAGSTRASRGRWPRAAPAPGSSTPGSRPSPPRTRWRRSATWAGSSVWRRRSATRSCRWKCTSSGTGTAARTRATATPAPAATWPGRCAAIRT